MIGFVPSVFFGKIEPSSQKKKCSYY